MDWPNPFRRVRRAPKAMVNNWLASLPRYRAQNDVHRTRGEFCCRSCRSSQPSFCECRLAAGSVLTSIQERCMSGCARVLACVSLARLCSWSCFFFLAFLSRHSCLAKRAYVRDWYGRMQDPVTAVHLRQVLAGLDTLQRLVKDHCGPSDCSNGQQQCAILY